MSLNPRDAFHELCAWTLNLGDAAFVHQHVVDADMAQTATQHTKPIGLTFALVGLYLHLERGFSGREVQRVHMRLARKREDWPRFPLPPDRGRLSAVDVLAAPPGSDRVRAIDAWCESVWASYQATHDLVAGLLRERGILES